ncbi:MAG: hypothetical protein V9G12_08405 [Microthrixaceae bacterium]
MPSGLVATAVTGRPSAAPNHAGVITDTGKLVALLAAEKGIEVRIRKMKEDRLPLGTSKGAPVE